MPPIPAAPLAGASSSPAPGSQAGSDMAYAAQRQFKLQGAVFSSKWKNLANARTDFHGVFSQNHGVKNG